MRQCKLCVVQAVYLLPRYPRYYYLLPYRLELVVTLFY
jgi:hypothetical protein